MLRNYTALVSDKDGNTEEVEFLAPAKPANTAAVLGPALEAAKVDHLGWEVIAINDDYAGELVYTVPRYDWMREQLNS